MCSSLSVQAIFPIPCLAKDLRHRGSADVCCGCGFQTGRKEDALQKELYEPANVGKVLGPGEVPEQSCSLLSSYGALPHGRPAPAPRIITHRGTVGMWLQQLQGHTWAAQGNLWHPHTAPMPPEGSETLWAGGGAPSVLVPLSPSLCCQHASSIVTSGPERGLLQTATTQTEREHSVLSF